MKWKVISASVRGSSHERTGLPNQDAADYSIAPRNDAAAAVLAVSDGHGGNRHFRSQVGSMLAVRVAVEAVREYLARTPGLSGPAALAEVGQRVVEAWQSAVGADLANNPFTEAELTKLVTADGEASKDSVVANPELAYGATLLVAAATDERMLYMQLGDGDILAVSANGATTRPIQADDRLVGNQTTSLCQPEAWREFRNAEVTAADGFPALVLLSTDGYVNSFRSQQDFLQIGTDYLQILRDQGSDSLAEELPRILTEATRQGSGDDITLGMLHVEVLPPATGVPAASAPGKPIVTQSAMIRELTAERTTQQQKLIELESNVAGAHKHVMQLRVIIAAVILIAIGAITHQRWWPLLHTKPSHIPKPVAGPIEKRPSKGGKDPEKGSPGKGDPDPGSIDDPAATPVAAGPPAEPKPSGDKWFLVVAGGKEVALTSGKTISSSQLVPEEARHAYAKVKKQDNVLVLTNLSSDAWTVISPNTGKKSIYNQNDVVTLHPDMKISFHKGEYATITVRN
jgi:serine/threonine protein phosphatase PrpC